MNKETKGIFISIEGGEGAGKTVAIQGISDYFTQLGYEVMITREPGGVSVSEKLRHVIMEEQMDNLTEAFLFASARREHLLQKVIPAMNQGKVVISDRYVDSSYVYQGLVKELGIPLVKNINDIATDGLMPSLTILMDVDPSIGQARIMENSQREVNRFDLESLSFHEKVRQGYLEVQSMEPERVKIIDANQTKEKVLDESISLIETFILGHS